MFTHVLYFSFTFIKVSAHIIFDVIYFQNVVQDWYQHSQRVKFDVGIVQKREGDYAILLGHPVTLLKTEKYDQVTTLKIDLIN